MPLPLILGIAAGIAGAGGLGSSVAGAVKFKKAKDVMKSADEKHKRNIKRLEEKNKLASKVMDTLGKKELEILESFKEFSEIIEKIQNRPEFDNINTSDVKLPKFDMQEIKTASVGASVLMGGLSGAALGTAGGFAAAGATSAAVMALGTASTGTAIASLSGAAATNATLAALGGGAIAVGGGGIALGTTILGAASLGVGLLIGGAIFSVAGKTLSKKADSAWDEMIKAEKEINKICSYLHELSIQSSAYLKQLGKVNSIYLTTIDKLRTIVEINNKTDWNTFSDNEKTITQNTVILVSLLYQMCKVKLVIQEKGNKEFNKVNYEDISKTNDLVSKVLNNNDFDCNIETDEQEIKNEPAAEIQFTDDENYCIAIVALMYYFAMCDGSISAEEKTVIDTCVDSLMFSHALSNDAIHKIYEIQKCDNISFDELCLLLNPVPIYKLEAYSSKLDEILNASDGLTDSEKEVKSQFEDYLKSRNRFEELSAKLNVILAKDESLTAEKLANEVMEYINSEQEEDDEED